MHHNKNWFLNSQSIDFYRACLDRLRECQLWCQDSRNFYFFNWCWVFILDLKICTIDTTRLEILFFICLNKYEPNKSLFGIIRWLNKEESFSILKLGPNGVSTIASLLGCLVGQGFFLLLNLPNFEKFSIFHWNKCHVLII